MNGPLQAGMIAREGLQHLHAPFEAHDRRLIARSQSSHKLRGCGLDHVELIPHAATGVYEERQRKRQAPAGNLEQRLWPAVLEYRKIRGAEVGEDLVRAIADGDI